MGAAAREAPVDEGKPSGFSLISFFLARRCRPGSPRPRLCLSHSQASSRAKFRTSPSIYRNGRSRIPLGSPRRSRGGREGKPSGFSLISLVAPHGSFAVLHGFGAVFAGSDADSIFDRDHKDLAIADLAVIAGAGGFGELVDHRLHDLRLHDRLDLEARAQRDVNGRSAVFLRVSTLGAAAFDLGHRHT